MSRTKPGIDKSRANKAGIEAYNDEAKTSTEIRQCKYLNNILEQDPLVERGRWVVKQKMVAALGFQTFHTAKDTLAGLELAHMIRKGQSRVLANGSNANQFNALAAWGEPDVGNGCRVEKFATEPTPPVSCPDVAA